MLHQWFDHSTNVSRGVLLTSNAGWGYEGVEREVQKLCEFYRGQSLRVDGQHMLALMLRNLPYLGKDVAVNTYSTLDFGWRYTNRFEVSHPSNQGKINPNGWFYHNLLPEIYILDDEAFDVNHAMENWKDLCPIQVKHHPYTTLSIGGLLRQWPTPERNGYAVISIHLAKLSLQYEMWKIRNPTLDIPVFLAQYPLINAVKSHYDIAVVNRFKAVWSNQPISPILRVCPMAFADYSHAIDRGLKTLVTRMRQRTMTYGEVLEAVPVPFAKTWAIAIHLPPKIPVIQIKWAYAAAKLPSLVFLLEMGNDQQQSVNAGKNGLIRQEIKEAYNERAYTRCFQGPQWQLMRKLEDLVGYSAYGQGR